MPSYLLVSIPEEDTLASPISRVKAVVGDGGISEFNIPRKLKFGTLNNLLELSDKLERFDRDYQGTCNRLIDALRDLVGASSDDLGEYLKIEERRSTDQYLREFDWNSTKYRPDRPINDILDSIAEDVGSIDQNLRTQLN
ncbi:Vacuolar ATP synthase subunit C, partial [Spiromyces aspiralis]